MSQKGTITTYESGVDFVVEWKIINFFNLLETDGAWYCSPDFSFGGERWCLVIFPNCWSENNSSGHVDLQLIKLPSHLSIKQSFSLSLKTVKGAKYNEQHFSKDFDDDNRFHRFNRFIPRSELSSRRTELRPDGTLTVICTMKSSISAGSASDSDSDSAERSSDSDSGECCHKCSNCLDIVKNQKKSLEELESEKERSKACVESCTQTAEERSGNDPERAYVEACTQTLEEEFAFNNPPEDCGFVTDINHLLKENRGVDVIFELEAPNGKTKLFAHKLILAVMSSYFADEFYDKGRNEGHQVIPLQGIDPKAFEQMIRYCYGEKPSLRTIEDSCALFKVASEFKVISLQNLCHTFFKHTKIEPGNVFSILKISVEMEDQRLQDMCNKILQEKTREVMSAYDLYGVTPAIVYTLLNLPKLSLNSEYELINWLFNWGKVKSENKNSSCISTRDCLAQLLQHMNFLALTVKEFAMLTRDNPNFFNSDEIASLSMNIVIPGIREMPVWHNEDLKVRVYTGSNE